jgi:hypothetical protein
MIDMCSPSMFECVSVCVRAYIYQDNFKAGRQEAWHGFPMRMCGYIRK